MKIDGWNCADGTEDEDHDWEFVSDWYGDPDVINGTCTFYYKRCSQCGKEEEATHQEYKEAREPDPDEMRQRRLDDGY